MPNSSVIRTDGLTKRFDRHVAVNEVDLDINAGDVYGLIGPNGAGKTTLIRMLAAAEAPTKGEIYIDGDRLQLNHDNPILKQRIGYLPDDFPVYDDLTVWDYLDYFARLYNLRATPRRRRLYEVLELVQLHTKRHSRIATLSRGMKQRLSLARTIIHEPMILFLDEPVSGLDPIARLQFRSSIKTLQAAGMTIVISSHVLSDLAELCTSIGVMELGCLVESASLADLYHRLGHQQLVIATQRDRAALIAAIRDHPQVVRWELESDERALRVDFSGNPDDAAALLRDLVQRGLPISTFTPTQDSLESLFFKLGHQQVS
jgi:ABC-2 type transport system ATP-binding protein